MVAFVSFSDFDWSILILIPTKNTGFFNYFNFTLSVCLLA